MESEYTPLIVTTISLLTILLLNFYSRRTKKKALEQIIQKRKTGGNTEMKNLATKYLNNTCVIYLFDGNTHKGIIKEVTDNGILLQKTAKTELLNIDFITRIKIVEKKG